MKKNVIIVCNEKYHKYAAYLEGLISSFDDVEGKQIGTPDGMVASVIWDEDYYKANTKSITSLNPVVFIGDSDYVKENLSHIDSKRSELGMEYGWLGNRAVLRVVPDTLNKDNAEQFYNLAAKYGKKFDEELRFYFSPEKAEEVNSNPVEHALAAAELILIPAHIADFVINKGKKTLASERLALGMGKGLDMINQGKANEQQYSLLTLMFYMDALSEFLGLQ